MNNKYKRDFIQIVYNYLPALFDDETKYHIIAQLALESSYGTSLQAQVNNNIAGMKMANTRITSRLNRGSTFACYASWSECVHDVVLWLAWRGATQANILQVWRNSLDIYCPDDGYAEKVETMYREIINIIKEV